MPSKRTTRAKVVSRFRGYDDDDDNDDDDAVIPMQQIPTVSQANASPAQTHAVSPYFNRSDLSLTTQNGTSRHTAESVADVQEAVSDEDESLFVSEKPSKVPTKRRLSSPDVEENEEALMDRLLPAATKIKRRKVLDEVNGIEPPPEVAKSRKKPEPKAAPAKKVSVKDVVRMRREAFEEIEPEEEDIDEALEGMTVDQMKRLAVVEEMEVIHREPPTIRNGPVNDDRWDERWNGRKNFKKFRRKGDTSIATRQGPSLIVPLEEVKVKEYGIGDAYWPEEDQQRKKKTQSQSQRMQLSQSQSQRTRTASGSNQQHHIEEVPSDLLIEGGSVPEAIDVDAPRGTRHHPNGVSHEGRDSGGSRSQAAAINGKRPLEGLAGVPQVKRRKKFHQSDDSDDD